MQPATLPPSSKTVLQILDDGGSMTHKDIVERSRLAPRTVRYALKKLKERGLIIEKFNFRDARQIIYQNRSSYVEKPQSAFA
ncbi:helix-turn-helix domain-containing protein [Methanoregula sp.]|uniref:MarR family transcriptional regulator n=1 Tax=Methanoregula sp. TaxID=2052170 RepID=UPI002630EC9E|nr:helix-turn-helix domain-containing protein [Methanoregula sp.]MDD5143834.1 helix-turn-helix domain-containing protein [Methanoregula sp.]